jgi:hypothetical protein
VAQDISDKKLTTIQLKGHRLSLDVYIAYLKNQQLSPPAQAIVDMLEQLRTGDAPPQDIGTLVGTILAAKAQKP